MTDYVRRSKDREIIKKHTHKEMLSLYRNALTRVYNLKLDNLQVEVTASFAPRDFVIRITVFSLSGDNCTISCYDFIDTGESANALKKAIELIKLDDFQAITDAGFPRLI